MPDGGGSPDIPVALGDEGLLRKGQKGKSTRANKREKAHKTGRGILFLLFFIVLGGVFAGSWRFTAVLDPLKVRFAARGGGVLAAPEDAAARMHEMVRLLTVSNLRQYLVTNEKIGRLIVIEGKVINKFDEPRELIRIEASLYDAHGQAIVSKDQFAGTMVTLFQLQVLSEEELEQALKNKWDIVTNNTNVPPGGAVPFMVIFYNPPDGVTDFNITVIGAQKPAK